MRPLVLLPALKATPLPGGRVGITGKFLTGLEAYVQAWDGPVRVLMESMPAQSENLDNTGIDPATLPFELELVNYDDASLDAKLADAGVVHGSVGYRQNGLAARCARLKVSLVTASEYTLKTRRQIVRANTRNPILRLRRELWEANQERANTATVRAAAGIQCNGTPTFEAYRDVSPSPLLYFDTRTHDADVLTDDALEARLERVLRGEPLKLLFSGRLDPMKGAQFLAPFAAELKARGVLFSLVVCGGGERSGALRDEVARLGVGDVVELKGVLDFQRELVPYVKSEVDVFVCPHVQGDPSCTYMETMACGVPIVGFDNEAFDGIVQIAPVGWLTDQGAGSQLVQRVVEIDQQRAIIAERSREALKLAREHTYESTFAARVAHLASLAIA